MEVRLRSDQGQPIVVSSPNSLHAEIYKNIADAVWTQIDETEGGGVKPAPSIVFE